MASYNQHSQLPYIPYKIIMHLMENNEIIWKILKYNDYYCLQKPDLTLDEKANMIWKDQSNMSDFSIFLTQYLEDLVIDARTILKVFNLTLEPINHLLSVATFELDVLSGAKVVLCDYNGTPCNRADIIQTELLKTLNGKINGVGTFQFNKELSKWCNGMSGIDNDKNYAGKKLVFAIRIGDINGC